MEEKRGILKCGSICIPSSKDIKENPVVKKYLLKLRERDSTNECGQEKGPDASREPGIKDKKRPIQENEGKVSTNSSKERKAKQSLKKILKRKNGENERGKKIPQKKVLSGKKSKLSNRKNTLSGSQGELLAEILRKLKNDKNAPNLTSNFSVEFEEFFQSTREATEREKLETLGFFEGERIPPTSGEIEVVKKGENKIQTEEIEVVEISEDLGEIKGESSKSQEEIIAIDSVSVLLISSFFFIFRHLFVFFNFYLFP